MVFRTKKYFKSYQKSEFRNDPEFDLEPSLQISDKGYVISNVELHGDLKLCIQGHFENSSKQAA